MTYAERRNLALAVLAAFIAILLLSACGTSQRALPAYERPLTKTDFQNVRTTAYTHTEADHRQYSNRNALGGELRAAGPPIHRAEVVPRAVPVYDVPRAIPVDETGETEVRRASYSPKLQPFSTSERRTTRTAQDPKGKIDIVSSGAAGSRERGGGLVALARRHSLPFDFYWANVSRGGLRLGAFRTQHDRSLYGEPARNEFMGRA